MLQLSICGYPSIHSRTVMFLLVLGAIIMTGTSAKAQSQEWVRQQNQQNEFKNNLWYGGGVALGFASNSRESDFLIGLFPMAGYHVTEQFSAGLRVGIAYNYSKVEVGPNNTENFNLIDYSFGPIARFKAFPGIFIHGELEFESNNYAFLNTATRTYETARDPDTNLYLGLGYNPGGYEILLLYNFNEDDNSLDIPFIFRIGYTINY